MEWQLGDLEALNDVSDSEACDLTISAMSFMDYMERDLVEDSRVDEQLGELAKSFDKEQSESMKIFLSAAVLVNNSTNKSAS